MKKLEDYISNINGAQSTQELFDTFAKIIADFGYQKVAYSFATDHPSLGLKRMHGHASSFPSDWMSHYAEKKLINVDPIPAYVMSSALPTFWSGATVNMSSAADQFMKDASDVGLKDGAIVPLHSTGGEIAAVSLSCDQKHPNQSYETLAALQLLGVYFHESYKSLVRKTDPIELSRREHEILTWAAEGKTDAEISGILHISLPTVRYHWKNIFKKLDAYSRVFAVTKAIRLHLVTPYTILKNYQV